MFDIFSGTLTPSLARRLIFIRDAGAVEHLPKEVYDMARKFEIPPFAQLILDNAFRCVVVEPNPSYERLIEFAAVMWRIRPFARIGLRMSNIKNAMWRSLLNRVHVVNPNVVGIDTVGSIHDYDIIFSLHETELHHPRTVLFAVPGVSSGGQLLARMFARNGDQLSGYKTTVDCKFPNAIGIIYKDADDLIKIIDKNELLDHPEPL